MPSPLDHGVDCVKLTKKSRPDKLGGEIEVYEAAELFTAVIDRDNSMLARTAEKQGVSSVYTVTVEKALEIKELDIFARLSDGRTFRATSNPADDETPAVASFECKAFSAEQYPVQEPVELGGMVGLALFMQKFWSQVLPAYVENAVPEGASLPYITYTLAAAPFTDCLQQVRIWTPGKSYGPLMQYCRRVEEIIPQAGALHSLPLGEGPIYLYRGTPFIQNAPSDEDNLRVAYINVIVRTYLQ